MTQEFQITGTRSLNEDINIRISPMLFNYQHNSVFMKEAQLLVNILRKYLPARTYNYLRDIMIKE